MAWRWTALGMSLSLILTACGGPAESCNRIIEDAAGMAVEILVAVEAAGEDLDIEDDLSFTEAELRAVADRVDALGCDPYGVSFETMTEFAEENDLTEEQTSFFYPFLLSLLDGTVRDLE